jgi:23S rRNA pseudouridine2605 synthase
MNKTNEKIRLNKFLALAGVCSRRKADELIKAGKVKVNGKPAKLGMLIDPEKDLIEVEGKIIKPERKRYLIFNKPCCVLTTLGKDNIRGRKTISDFIEDIPERVFPVGRLDYNTTGLLILTNDGELAQRILHPRYKLPKVYQALVEGKVDVKTLKKMKKGAILEDGFAKPDDIRIIRYEGDSTLLEIVFHEGRKHIVKRFLAHFGHKVKRLHRTQIGPIKLGKLSFGKYREMTPIELNQLFHAVGLKPKNFK